MLRRFFHDPLAVEVEPFEPMKKKPQLDTTTESDGVFLISNLSVSYYPESVTPQTVLCQCYIVFVLQLKVLMCMSH